MEEQVPEDVIKARFDRLLKEVQKISAEKAGGADRTDAAGAD